MTYETLLMDTHGAVTLVLTGSEKAFAAGADIKEIQAKGVYASWR